MDLFDKVIIIIAVMSFLSSTLLVRITMVVPSRKVKPTSAAKLSFNDYASLRIAQRLSNDSQMVYKLSNNNNDVPKKDVKMNQRP